MKGEFERGEKSNWKMPLHQPAEFFTVFIFHVHKLDAASVRTDVANDGGEMNLAQAGAHLELDRVANAQFLGRFQIGPAQANGFDPRETRLCAIDLRAQR